MKLWLTNKDAKDTKEGAAPAPATGIKKVIYIKTSKKITKFKVRGKKYLYTFKTSDPKTAKSIKDTIPSSKIKKTSELF